MYGDTRYCIHAAHIKLLCNAIQRSETPADGVVLNYYYKQLVGTLFKASDRLPKQNTTGQYSTNKVSKNNSTKKQYHYQPLKAENKTTSEICTGMHATASTQHTSNCCAMQYKEVKLQLLE
ncbi:hypothetical protein DPMN_190648 [Dreissena polymorpha]|uniref:Uncharacterized protein n=1 Tax=Dreissena polymorpha TaxID=45954 RepID=A0A9D3XZJ7_DREPO|nr:hypothetical protein DPMN_190648 [Dreissena polymorpha]